MTYVIDANTGRVTKDNKKDSSEPILNVSAVISGSGDNTIIAAPTSGKQIVVYAFVIQNESTVATTMILGENWRVLAQNQGDGLAMIFDSSTPWKLEESTALVLNLSGENQCNYSVQYSVEVV